MDTFNYEKKIYGTKERIGSGLLSKGLLDLIPKEFKLLRGRVLDIGCGAGYFTGRLQRERSDLSIYGVDISETAIKAAKKDFPDNIYSVVDTYKLPFPDNYFNGIIMQCVLEHLDDPSKALREIKRVLKRGGTFFSVTPIEGDRFVFFQSFKLTNKYHGHLQRFSRNNLLNLFLENGYKIKKKYYWGYFLCQFIAGFYLFIFEVFKVSPEFSVKGYIDNDRQIIGRKALTAIRNIVNTCINIESFFIPKRFVGLYMHIIVTK
jgi:ubiquinone/menaquinone biosynthesis C-methylase UbiE